MDRIFVTLGDAATDPRLGGADSFSDRLNCKFTVFLLLTFALMVTGKLFVGEPISCYCPSHFTSSHVSYANTVCWTINTYYLPFQENIPKEGENHQYISYYQWVPLMLTVQAVLFYLPRPIWLLLNTKSGIAVSTLTDAAIECQRQTNPDARDKILRYMSKQLGRFLLEMHKNRQMASVCKGFWLKLYGNYLLIAYIWIKFLYIGNVVGQIFLLDSFLGGNYHLYGPEVAFRLFRGEEWRSSGKFPRVTMCDFEIRSLGNVNRYTVQCSLPLNLLNEIIFVFLWFWFAFVAVTTIGSLVMWIIWASQESYTKRYVTTRLAAMEELNNLVDRRMEIRVFVSEFLKKDGCFILRMVAKNASDIVAAEMVVNLWKYFVENNRHFKKLTSTEESLVQSLANDRTPVNPNRGFHYPSAPKLDPADAGIYKH